MASLYFPGSDSVTQNFSSRYPGALMKTNTLLWHDTEGVSWPGYNGGATAPNSTVFLSIKERRMYMRSHFAWNRSARALENRPGGVETNTLNVFQVEIIGTCDPRYRKTWGTMTAGVDYFYIPDLPQWAIDELAKIPAWLHQVSPAFPIVDGAPRGWLPYPASYGNDNGQRMTTAEWNAGRGMIGHQHARENDHGDPGDLDVPAIVTSATGTVVPPAPPVVVPPVVIDAKDPKNYFVGAKGDYITDYGKRIVLWSAALGLPAPYKIGPGPSFTTTDQAATQRIQVALGYDVVNGKRDPKQLLPGGSADGLPGPVTLKTLFSTPPAKPKTVTVTTVSQNMAGNNAHGIRTAKSRITRFIGTVKADPVDVIDAQETTVASTVRPRLDSGLKPLGMKRTGGGMGRYVYTDDRLEVIAAGLITAPKSAWYKLDDKQAGYTGYRVEGARGMDVSFHAESDLGKKPDELRVKQMLYFAAQSLMIAAKNGIPAQNILLAGDTNSEGMVLAAMIKAGWRNVAAGTDFEGDPTFIGWDGRSRKRYDYGFVRADALPAELVAITYDARISDHGGLKIIRQLTK